MNQIPPEFISMMAESNRQQANFNKLMEEIKTKPKSIDSVVDTTPNTISRLNHSDDFYKNIINKKDEDENDT
jgi:chaperonin cofactor prefoldin